MRPGQQGRHDQPDAFAAARGRERHDMLRAIMAQIILAHLAKEDTGTSDQAGALQVARAGPARGAVSRDQLRLPRPPDRTDHRRRSEEHTSELQSLMRISYAVFCLKKKTKHE